MSQKFSGVTGQKLALGEVEESQGFLEVKHSKYKKGFFTFQNYLQYSNWMSKTEDI